TGGGTLLKEWAVSGELTMPVIMMSGHATIDAAVEATRLGALDFLEKPITMQKLLRVVETCLQRGRASAPAAAPAAGRTGAAAPTVTAWMPVSAPGQPVAGAAPGEGLPVDAPSNGEQIGRAHV